jgi:anti-sigma regulatory factor (Ser/Thr protein kinase)
MAAQDSPFARFRDARKHARQAGCVPVDLSGQDVGARLHMQLKAGPQAASEGRHALDQLDASLAPDQLSELRLLVTELVTNSVRHGTQRDDWITLDVEVCVDGIRVVVTDRGPGFEPSSPPRPHPDRPGGWGLCLVDRLADRWGVVTNGATAVWFELDRDLAHAA